MRAGMRWCAVSAAVVALLAACGGGGDGDAQADGAEGADGSTMPAPGEECTEERAGGSVTMGMGAQLAGLDPAAINGSPSTGGVELAQIYDTLVEYDPESGEYGPRVAESLEPDEDYGSWTLTLRSGVTFGNGDPLTAQAVAASIERFGELNTGPYKNLVDQIADIEVVDDLTAVFHLNEPWAGFPFTLANTPGMIVNTAVADAAGEDFATEAAGSGAGVGAYEASRFAPGEEVVLTARDDYWDGPVCVEELRFVPLAAESGRYDSFETGEFDATWLRDPVVLRDVEDAGVPAISSYQNAQNVVLFNVEATESAVNDVRLRRAVSMLVDTETVANRATEGEGHPTSALVGEGSRFYDGLEGPQPDPEAAAELIDEVKADGWDGRLRLMCAATSEEESLAIEAMLEAADIEVEVELAPDTGVLVETVIVRQDFDMACWGLNIIDDGLWPTLNNSLGGASASNYGRYADEGMDSALAALRVAATDVDVVDALATVQERWTETVPALVLNAGRHVTIHRDDLRGIQPTSNGLVLFDDAYLEG